MSAFSQYQQSILVVLPCCQDCLPHGSCTSVLLVTHLSVFAATRPGDMQQQWSCRVCKPDAIPQSVVYAAVGPQ